MSSNKEHLLSLPLMEEKNDHVCMPMAINVISQYWGEDNLLNNNKVNERSKKYTNANGTIFIEGIEIAEEQGFKVYIYKGTLKDLKRRIDQGIPIIAIMAGINNTTQHASVVIGYNSEEHRMIIYVPEPDAFGAIPENIFLDLFEQDGSVTLTIVPKDMESVIEKDKDNKLNESYRLCLKADRLTHFKKMKDSIELLEKAVKIDKENDFAWNMLGSLYNDLDSNNAKSCFEKCLGLNPRFYLSLRGLGNYYLKKEDYLNAEKFYSEAISVHHNRFPPIYKNRAIARIKLDKKEEAKSDLKNYITQSPKAKDRGQIELTLKEL